MFERTPPFTEQVRDLKHALSRLPIAAGLACVLAFRPRRKGTPPRQMPVIQTQIILAVVGAVVMLVVGSSLARAFGIVGAAGLVRYRAKIDDPKDAGVMLSTLAVGLAAGVGVWLLAGFATLFILALLWIVESFEPKATQLFTLKVMAKDPAAIKPKLDALLTRYRLDFELRGTLEGGAALRSADAGRGQDRSAVGSDPEARPRERERGGVGGEEGEEVRSEK